MSLVAQGCAVLCQMLALCWTTEAGAGACWHSGAFLALLSLLHGPTRGHG